MRTTKRQRRPVYQPAHDEAPPPQLAPDPGSPGRWRQTSAERFLLSADTPRRAWELKKDFDEVMSRRGAHGWSIDVRHIPRDWPYNDVWHLYAVADSANGHAADE